MTSKVESNLRFLYVSLVDAADEAREHLTEFSLGLAHGYDNAADLIKILMEELDD